LPEARWEGRKKRGEPEDLPVQNKLFVESSGKKIGDGAVSISFLPEYIFETWIFDIDYWKFFFDEKNTVSFGCAVALSDCHLCSGSQTDSFVGSVGDQKFVCNGRTASFGGLHQLLPGSGIRPHPGDCQRNEREH
jgi:hypothetical protein